MLLTVLTRGSVAPRSMCLMAISETPDAVARSVCFQPSGLLVEFASVVDAVRCAVAVQQAMPERNRGAAADRRIELRIGINLGDVIVEGDDLYGDGVNIAARIEALPDAGGVFVSNTVHDHVRDRLPFAFEDLGEQQVKNIVRPVRVYRVQPERPLPSPLLPGLDPGITGSARVGTAEPLPLPDKPSVAVLPFTNMSTDPEHEFFADGIAEDVITALSRYPSLFVIARNSCFTYKGRAVDVKQVGRELGVRYVLEGSLRKAGNRIRVTAQLVEAETGKHVWAERYDRDLADIFVLQDDITEAVTIAIAPAIADAEQQRAMRKPPGSLDAWAAYQRGLWHLSKFTSDDTALGEKFFQNAIDLDSNFSAAYVGLAIAQDHAAEFRGRGLLDHLTSMEALARRAVALDGADAEARSLLGHVLWRRGDHEGALAEAERALATTPNLAFGHHVRGTALIFSGHSKEGVAALERSIRLDPRDPRSALRLSRMALGLYFSAKYEASVLPVAGCCARPARSDRRCEGGAGTGHRDPADGVRESCPRAPAVDAAGRPRPYGRRPAQGRLARNVSQTHRLAAILAADVAGYSRLMGADEEGPLAALRTRMFGLGRLVTTP
jgi:adenylate cyclase